MASMEPGSMSVEDKKAPHPWITHVKSYAAKNNVSYKDALQAAGATYQRSTKPKKEKTGKHPWMDHIAEWKRSHPKWKETHSYKQVLQLCKQTYYKQQTNTDSTKMDVDTPKVKMEIAPDA